MQLRALPPSDTASAAAQQRQYSWSYSQTDSSQINAYAARQVPCIPLVAVPWRQLDETSSTFEHVSPAPHPTRY